eukprot:TRINITY_DN14043_c0_g1_i1.p1 TRINITY_DN14043_c0_g1~~TRINITY_DN14043_c0_g1_i1.p1  ORF type:complete len:390 (-),score=98.06 TRINITY_DN14043_c0_g1_i1:32-1201(-)
MWLFAFEHTRNTLPLAAPPPPRMSHVRWGCLAMLWMISFNWCFSRGIMSLCGDLCLLAHGGMFWQVNWPSGWSVLERLDVPADLDAVCPPGRCAQTIQKVIHQTYKTTELPVQWKDTPEKWKSAHPGWEYKFWTDASARAFIRDEYPWFLDSFDSYEHPIQRADAIRYFAVYHFGGVYADLDLQPRGSVEQLVAGAEVLVFETPNMGLTNMMFGATKGSSFLKCVLAQLPVKQHQWHHFLVRFKSWKILSSTGPTFWWSMTSPHVCGRHFGAQERLRTVSANFMGRCSLCKGDVSKCAKHGLLRHLVGSSWHTADASFVQTVFVCQPGVAWALLYGVLLKLASILRFVLLSGSGTLLAKLRRCRKEAERCVLLVLLASALSRFYSHGRT